MKVRNWSLNREMPKTPLSPGRLVTLTDVTREMRKVYRLSRLGQIATQDMSRFVNALNVIQGSMRGRELEERIAKLEELLLAASNQ